MKKLIFLITTIVISIQVSTHSETYIIPSPGAFISWNKSEGIGFGLNCTMNLVNTFTLIGAGVGIELKPKRHNISLYTEVQGGVWVAGLSGGTDINITGVDEKNQKLEAFDPYFRLWAGYGVYYSRKISVYKEARNIIDMKPIPILVILSPVSPQ